MPQRQARKSNQQKAAEKANEILAQMGLAPVEVEIPDHNPMVAITQEANAVLWSLDFPHSLVTFKCKECAQSFRTNYRYNRYCSEDCLKAALKKRGLEWDPTKSPEERWKGVPPATLSPEALRSLQEWARSLIEESSQQLERMLREGIVMAPGLSEANQTETSTVQPPAQIQEEDQEPDLLADISALLSGVDL